jgi:hypothetical protein
MAAAPPLLVGGGLKPDFGPWWLILLDGYGFAEKLYGALVRDERAPPAALVVQYCDGDNVRV